MKTSPGINVHLLKQLFAIDNNWQNVFYLHTPFCLQRCHYCVYSSRVPTGGEELEAFYRQVLPSQLEHYQPVLEEVPFNQVYFGGGTPTIAAAETLARIYRQIPNFERIPVKTTEISPYTVSAEHLDLFHRCGFNYVSMGVQTLNGDILAKENRLQANVEKLIDICRQLDRCNIVSNVDLIFYLGSGELEDLSVTRGDLETMMSVIRPVSLTLHSNYRLHKSLEKRTAMIKTIGEMLEKYPEYRCVNSLLEEAEIEYDAEHSAEYRLMRKQENFLFYMIPKIPKTYPFGHNILSIGEYMEVKPWSNYYYIYTLRDKYLWKECYRQSKAYGLDFERTREKLALSHHHAAGMPFFRDEAGREQFKWVLKQTGNPYYEFN
jgi:coproporphyrinogen III oxidase-like Fe-S oxidoreductase